MSHDTEENGRPKPEVNEKPVRRRFTAEYKTRILEEADRCTETGEVGELLRREGLYSSNLSNWRRLRDEGSLASLTPKKRGRKPKPNEEATRELERLRRENQRLAERLRQAETIIDVQKKVCEMLGIAPPKNNDEKDE
jgi:transposase-like protein